LDSAVISLLECGSAELFSDFSFQAYDDLNPQRPHRPHKPLLKHQPTPNPINLTHHSHNQQMLLNPRQQIILLRRTYPFQKSGVFSYFEGVPFIQVLYLLKTPFFSHILAFFEGLEVFFVVLGVFGGEVVLADFVPRDGV